MPEKDPIVYRYTGPGHFPGVPAKDLTAARFARLTHRQRRDVEAGTIYRAVETKTATAAVRDADKAAQKAAEQAARDAAAASTDEE